MSPSPEPVGYVLVYDHNPTRAKAASYSSYGGYVTHTGKNVFGQRCLARDYKMPRVWQTEEGAGRACEAHNEEAARPGSGTYRVHPEPLYPTDEDLREQLRMAMFKDPSLLAKAWRCVLGG